MFVKVWKCLLRSSSMTSRLDHLVLLLPLKQSLDRFLLAVLTLVFLLIMLPPTMPLSSQETTLMKVLGDGRKPNGWPYSLP